MPRMAFTSAAATAVEPRNWRLFLVVFLVKIWRLKAWPRLTVPPGRTTKRFLALLLVFILGITTPFWMNQGGFNMKHLGTRPIFLSNTDAWYNLTHHIRPYCIIYWWLNNSCNQTQFLKMRLALILLFLAWRRQHHNHLATFQLRHCLHLRLLSQLITHALKQLHTNILVRHLTTTITQSDFDFVTIF